MHIRAQRKVDLCATGAPKGPDVGMPVRQYDILCANDAGRAPRKYPVSKTHDWFDAKSTEMRPVIEAKHKALIEYKRSPSERNLQILRAARSKVQQTAKRCANEYWTQLSQDIQTAAITGNIRGMYDGIKKALGPTQSKTAPLKSSSGAIITDKGQQMERWVEHYSDLYSRENTVSPAALDVIECLPTMDELDSEPSVE